MNHQKRHSPRDKFFNIICLLIVRSALISLVVLGEPRLEIQEIQNSNDNDQSATVSLPNEEHDKLTQESSFVSLETYSNYQKTETSPEIEPHQEIVDSVSDSTSIVPDLERVANITSIQNDTVDTSKTNGSRRIYKCKMHKGHNPKVIILSAKSVTDYIYGKKIEKNVTLEKNGTLLEGGINVTLEEKVASNNSDGDILSENNLSNQSDSAGLDHSADKGSPDETLNHYQIQIDVNGTKLKIENEGVNQENKSDDDNNDSEGKCILMLFYYDWCPFSAAAAKHYHAIARLFPNLTVMALDAYGLNGLTMRYGMISVPTILFFFDEKLIERYNETQITVDQLANFVHQLTSIEPNGEVKLIDQDNDGPLPIEPVSQIDYVLVLACLFNIVLAIYFIVRSQLVGRLIEFFRNITQGVLTTTGHQQQHEHFD